MEKAYDNAINEGGEGYNPYRAKREKEEWLAEQDEARKYAATPQGKIDALYRRIKLECGSVAREWGNSEEINALQSSLYAEINKIEAEIKAEFLNVWTLDTTKSRRKTWNSMVKAGKFGKIGGGQVDFVAVLKQETAQGWTLESLRRAIKAHNL